MLEATNERIITSVCFSKWPSNNLLKIASKISDDMIVLNGEPFILSGENEVPNNFPRMILKNEEEDIKLQITADSADLIIDGVLARDYTKQRDLTLKLIDSLIALSWNIDSVEVTYNTKVSLKMSGLASMKEKYLSNQQIKDAFQVKLGWTKKVTWGACDVEQGITIYTDESEGTLLFVTTNFELLKKIEPYNGDTIINFIGQTTEKLSDTFKKCFE